MHTAPVQIFSSLLSSIISTRFFAGVAIFAGLCSFSGPKVYAGAFAPGNLVVERLGDGTTTLGSTAAQISVVEYNISGGSVQTITFPTTGSNQQTDSGTATSNGYLGSYNGFLAVPGYNNSAGAASVASQNTKVTSIIDSTGNVANRVAYPTGGPTVTPPSPFSGNNLRSAIATGANTFYAVGNSSGTPNTGGVWYYNGSAFTQVSTSPVSNIRNVEIYNGNLYYSTGSGTTGIYQVGTGLPDLSGQTATLIFAATSPSGFVLFDTNGDGTADLAYVADDGTTTGGGLKKYTYNSGTSSWSNTWSLLVNASNQLQATAGTGYTGIRGLTGTYSGGVVTLYATTTETANNRIIQITDSGSTPSSATAVASAGANYVFRGVDFGPASAATPTITAVTLTNALTNTYGTASAGISYTPTGTRLTGQITNTPAVGFEISTNNVTWTTNATGVTNNATVWVRTSASKSAGTNDSTVLATLSGGGAANSVSVTSSASGNVVSKATPNLTITSTNSAVAGGTLPLTTSSPAASASVPPSTGVTTYSSSNTNVVSISGTTASMMSVGTATLTANQAADANYNAATATQNFTVAAPSGSLSVSGTLLAFSSTYGAVSSSQSFTVSGSNLDSSGVTVTPPGGFEVSTTSDFTVVGTAAAPLSLGTSATINTAVYVRLSTSNAAGPLAIGSISIAGGGAPAQTLSIPASNVTKASQASVSGTLVSTTLTYGLTTTVTGSGGSGTGVYEYQQNGGTGGVSITGSTILFASAGTANIEVRRLGDANYNNSGWVSVGTLTLNKANQTITFAALSPVTTVVGSVALSATVDSGLTITYTSLDTSVATVSGGTLTIVGPGTCDITASQAGDDNYNAATSVSRTLTVTEAGFVPFSGTSSYTQDFQAMSNGVAGSMNVSTMTEVSSLSGGNSNVTGWYLYGSGWTGAGNKWQGSDSGSSNTGGFRELIDNNSPVGRALGSQGSGTAGGFYGLVLKNTSGATLNRLNLGYDAVMNRNPSTTANAYPLSYLVSDARVSGGTNGNSGTFADAAGTWINGIGFTTPTNGIGSPSTNQAAISPLFKIATITQTLTNLNWSNGAYLYIRWKDTDEGGSDATAGVDNVTVDANYPLPVISGFSPSSVPAGGSNFTLAIYGSNFFTNSTVSLAGVAKTVTFIDSTQLTIPVTATEIASEGSLSVQVTNPSPGGGSASQTFAVSSAPSLTLVAPVDNSAFASSIQTPTTARSFTVSGSSLTTGITVTAPSGFEVSSDNSSFSSSLLVARTGSGVPATTLYLRFNPAAVQSYSGSVTAATDGVTPSPSFAVLGNASVPPEGKLTGIFADGSATLTATAPSAGMVTEYIVLAKVGSAITDVPTGDGSGYSASATYGSGIKIGDSYVVYKGSTPPSAYQVTGLTNRLRYYFSMYSRVATAYSTANSTNGFPYPTLGSVITQWDFNSQPLDNPANTGTGTFSPITGVGTFSGAGLITTATYATGAGSTDSVSSDNSGAQTSGYPAATAGSGTSGVAFSVSTVGKQNIVVYWDVRHSSSASRYLQFQYSTDGGTTWNNYSATGDLTDSGYYVANTGDTWFLQRKADLSGIPAVNNNANFAFRIVTVFAPSSSAYAAADSGKTYTTNGTLRYDMVTVTGVDGVFNNPPTGITLSANTIAENNAADALVGALSGTDVDSGDTLTYSLVSGVGSTDNASFRISGNQLRVRAVLDFDTKSSYLIRVRTTDAGGATYEKEFTITVTNVIDSPAEYKADWLAANGLATGSDWNSDPRNVGYSLATAYAFGLSPSVWGGAPITLVSSPTGSVKVVYLRRDISSGVTYAVKTGTDLAIGLNGSDAIINESASQPSPPIAGYTRYEATYTPSAPATKGFVKVEATLP